MSHTAPLATCKAIVNVQIPCLRSSEASLCGDVSLLHTDLAQCILTNLFHVLVELRFAMIVSSVLRALVVTHWTRLPQAEGVAFAARHATQNEKWWP